MSSAPQIPPRPGRSQAEIGGDALHNAPVIPPRPQRRNDRSISPSRAEFSRSPLNELPPPAHNGKAYGDTLSSSDLPRRPSSAFRPSGVGEEGMEYSSFDDQEAASSSPKQTRNVAADLPMHAPTASVPISTAKSRIQTVTRTDSSQAAAAGVGKSSSEPEIHPLKARSSFSRSNLSVNHSGDEDHEHGPPSMGLTVPMLKYAGDAQAPSPAPGASVPGTPSGYFKEGAPGRNHHRKRSSRQEFGPPGSYGLHGHGLNSFHGITEPKDQFEKDWYQKHPEEYKREQGRVYDPGHPSHDWALSSDDLNKLVHQSSNRGLGMGTSPDAIGTPSEQIGYLASEEYASRMSSPRPTSVVGRKRLSSGNQPAVSSPLREASAPDPETAHIKSLDDDHALESETEDIIHVDPPAHRASKIGGGGYDPPTEDFGPQGGNTEEEGGWVIENGYGVPILASDEVAKNLDPSAEYMQPAISPEQERRGSDYYAGWDSEAPGSYQTGRRSSKDAHKRSGSGGDSLSRVRTREAVSGVGTPLEEIEEYEPLFPEEDEKEAPKPTAVDHLKRPDLARHHFPSQDVWEDVPESLQYSTTVDTPQEPEDLTASTTFEHPAKEAARKDGNIPTDRADFLSDEAIKMAKPQFKPGVMDEVRPNMRHRFPSQDIWEDTPDSLQYQTTVDTPQEPEDLESSTGTLPPAEELPKVKFNSDVEELRHRPDIARRFPSHDIWEDSPDSLHLETTVSGPQTPEENPLSPEDARSPPTAFGFPKPQLPARPARPSKLSEEVKPTPSIPARPPQRLRQVPPADAEVPQIPARPGAGASREVPALPDRPKPQIPARPARAPRTESQENTLTKSVSNVSAGSAESGSVKSPPEVKAKPAVPARPVNANFASLRAGFMNDLNSRLKLGPVASKKEEENLEEIKPEEKAPLADARKGRAKGPARRKPAPSAAAVSDMPTEQKEASSKSLSLAFSTTTTLWAISEEGDVHVPELGAAAPAQASTILSPQEEIEKIAEANTDSAAPTTSSNQDPEPSREGMVNNTLSDPVGAEGDAADASQLSAATQDRSHALESGMAAALADSRASGDGPAQGSTDVASHVSEFSSEVPLESGREGKEAATEQVKSEALADAAPTAELPGQFIESDDEEANAGKSEMKDTSAQTGEKDVTFRSPTGEEEKMTITLGGRAPEEGDVVTKGGEEKVVGAGGY